MNTTYYVVWIVGDEVGTQLLRVRTQCYGRHGIHNGERNVAAPSSPGVTWQKKPSRSLIPVRQGESQQQAQRNIVRSTEYWYPYLLLVRSTPEYVSVLQTHPRSIRQALDTDCCVAPVTLHALS
jgi:hypothetical protein